MSAANPTDKPAKTLYLIDGHAQFFRAYYAIRGHMSSPVTKEPTNLTYGFVGMMLKLFRDYQPDYVAVVIDVSGDRETFRSEIFPEYKAHRDPAPSDFHPQVERCLELLDTMQIPVIGVEGVEADDIIATIVRRMKAEHPEVSVRIVSKDKDLTQLLNHHVELFDVHKDQAVTAADVFKVEGVQPEHVGDILALMGDTVDNIPGVPGIGPKTAAQLILKYGSLDNLLAHLDEIKGKRRENLEASRELLPLSRQLVALKDDVEIDFDLERTEANPKALPIQALDATFQELGFNSYPDDFRKLVHGEDAVSDAPIAPPVAEEGGLFAFARDPVAAPARDADVTYETITTLDQLDTLVELIRQAGCYAVDTETDGLAAMQSNLCGVSVAIEPGRAWYIPCRSPQPETHLNTEQVMQRLKPVLEDASLMRIGHNLKFDQIVLRRHGALLAEPMFDTMVASYVVDATRSSHKLDVLALAMLNHRCVPITDLIGRGKSQRTFDTVPLEQAAYYAAEDADITLRLHDALAPQLAEIGLRSLFDDVEMSLVPVLAELEFNGIRVDPDELDRQRVGLQERIDALRQSIIDDAPHAFNPDSPKQLSAALFNKPDQDPPGLGLKALKRGKTGPSTDVEVLEKLAADDSIESTIPQRIVEYRQLTKLVNTYLEALKQAINPHTQRVHASFNQTVAATGRLSSSDPNLQNIPIRTDVGREIRRAFIADPGNVLITADYSQIELRLLAHLSEDPALIEAFEQGMDIHTAVAAEVYGVEPDDVTPVQRSSAKMVNFGIVYGITAYGLARRLGGGVSVEQASGIIADYKARFQNINVFLEQCVTMARDTGYVETILKRRRAVPQVRDRNPQQRALGERMAINTVVQGSAADLIKLAMIDLHRRLPDEAPEARMLLQIHDELVLEAPEPQAAPVRDWLVQRMEAAMPLRVPLVVEAAWSANWIDAK